MSSVWHKLIATVQSFCRSMGGTSVDSMPPYITSFEEQDRTRAFGFLAMFSRWECALKHGGFVRAGTFEQAEADWDSFANKYAAQIIAHQDTEFTSARARLLSNPPKHELLSIGTVSWQDNPRRANETDAVYLLRVVRDIRNNLFHGGKYSGGPEPETARDRALINCAVLILKRLLDLDAAVRARFEESV